MCLNYENKFKAILLLSRYKYIILSNDVIENLGLCNSGVKISLRPL